MTDESQRWRRRYERERAARLQAEQIAESAIAELWAANRELDDRVIERTHEVEAALRDVEAARRAESTFLRGLAHELSTPLHAILGLVELVGERSDDAQVLAEAREVRRSTSRLHEVLRTLVEYAAVSGTEVAVSLRPERIADFADELTRKWQLAAAQQGMLLVVEIETDPQSMVVMDPERVSQIVDALLDNAVRFGAGRVHVSIGVEAPMETGDEMAHLRVRVTDEGPGISAELGSAMFEPFVRGSRSTGLGVGLPLARAVALALGGTVELVGAQVGASFEARVPVGHDLDDRRRGSE